MKWSNGSYDGGGRAHGVAFDPNNPGCAALIGDVWGYFRTYDGGNTWIPVMSGSKIKNNGSVSGDIYGRAVAFSKMRNGRAYFGCGTLTGGISGWFGHVEKNTQQVVKDNTTTYGFGTTFAVGPASVSPRPAGRLIETDYDSVHGVEYVYLACPTGLVRAIDDGSNPLQFTLLYDGSTVFGRAWKFICMYSDASFYAGTWGDRLNSTSGSVFHCNSPRTSNPGVVAESGAPPFVNDMKLIGGTLYAVANGGWFGTLTEGGPWVQMASTFFAGCDLSSVCGVGNVLYVSTSSHPAGQNKWWAKSVDGGNNWQWLTNINNQVQGTNRQWWLNPAGDGQNKGPNDQFATNHMDCDPSDPNTFISASFRGGWSTRDGGATIHPSMNGLGGSEVSHILVNGPGDITNDDVDWHGAHTTDHYGTMAALASDPVGFVNSGVGPKTFFGHNYVMQSVTPPADITKDGVSIADEYFRARCLSPADYQVDADGYVYIALYGGGVLVGNPNPVDVDIITPTDGDVLQVSSVFVQAKEHNGLAIDHATVQINSSTPLSMTFNNATSSWERIVAIPQGSISITVVMTQLDGSAGSSVANITNGTVASPGPLGNVLFPIENQILTGQQVTVSCDWESQQGIDPNSVQISVDNGQTWAQMDAPGINTPG